MYYIKKTDNKFSLIEKRKINETVDEIVLFRFDDRKYAGEIMDFFRNGGAFSGWTPGFILKGIR